MSEKMKNNPEGQQPEETGKKSEGKEAKKECWVKRKIWNPVKKKVQQHPGLAMFLSSAAGAGATYGVTKLGQSVLENRKQRNCYVPQENNEVSPLDPNV